MKKSDFWFDLPEEQIAQTPIEPRDHSRLMVLGRETGSIEHQHFYDIVDLLSPGDLLVVNDSRVLPARLFGVRQDTGGPIEFVLLENKGDDVWEVLVRPGRRAKTDTCFVFGDGLLHAQVLSTVEGGNRLVRFCYEGNFYEVLDKVGQMPLPPYITTKLSDKERYQTVYSHEPGSAAAPTAGLHFTKELIERLKARGIGFATITLHVGLGTFRPVKVDNITEHHMHAEHYFVTEETAKQLNDTKANGGRIIGVGTTSCRTLESIATDGKPFAAGEGYTDIFIYPGYTFKALDGMITNFHLPESTLIMMVSAFAGYENTMAAYKEAVNEQYRFFSFGDAMAIL